MEPVSGSRTLVFDNTLKLYPLMDKEGIRSRTLVFDNTLKRGGVYLCLVNRSRTLVFDNTLKLGVDTETYWE